MTLDNIVSSFYYDSWWLNASHASHTAEVSGPSHFTSALWPLNFFYTMNEVL